MMVVEVWKNVASLPQDAIPEITNGTSIVTPGIAVWAAVTSIARIAQVAAFVIFDIVVICVVLVHLLVDGRDRRRSVPTAV